MTKDEIKEMLETIENDSELKDKFCNMMDTYRSKIWYHVDRDKIHCKPHPGKKVVPNEDVPNIKTASIQFYPGYPKKDVTYIYDPERWDEGYWMGHNTLKCEVRKGESLECVLSGAVYDNEVWIDCFKDE